MFEGNALEAAFFFFFCLFLRCSKGNSEGGLAILRNQKDSSDFDHQHLIQYKITAHQSLTVRHVTEMETYNSVHKNQTENERGLLLVL